jgi:hypothetical protein
VITTTDPAVAWLLDEGDPAVRALARRELLDAPTPAEASLSSPLVRTLLTTPAPTPLREVTDGGWNCDRRPEARHSSLHETLPALSGLHEYAAATGGTACARAVGAAGSGVEAVDWAGVAHQMVTLNALRVGAGEQR